MRIYRADYRGEEYDYYLDEALHRKDTLLTEDDVDAVEVVRSFGSEPRRGGDE